MALSIANGSMRTPLLQQKFVDGDSKHKFRLDKGATFCWMLPPHHNMFLAVVNNSQDNDAGIIQWEWMPNAPNMMFQFIYAGNGYYLIKALHSGKFLDVHKGSIAEGGAVIQHPLRRGDNQLFKVVPVPDNQLHGSPESYVEVNDKIRMAVTSLVSGIPKAGAGIAFIVKAFWKEKNVMSDFWEQMKSYVDNRVRELIRADKIDTLTITLNGKLDSLDELNNTPEADKKNMGERIYGAIDDIVRNQGLYIPVNDNNAFENDGLDEEDRMLMQANAAENSNATDPDIRDILPLFIGIGTILITLRRTIAYDRETWFTTTISDEQKATNKRLLVDTITKYKKHLLRGKTRLVEWRLKMIKDAYTDMEKPAGSTDRTYTSYATDDYGIRDERRWSVKWEYWKSGHGSDTSGDPNHFARAKHAVAQRRAYIKEQFEAEIDEMLQLARYWGDLDPAGTKYVPQTIRRNVGSFGGWPTYKGFGGVANKAIAKIIIHNRGNSICGIEVSYKEKSSLNVESDGVSSGLVGVAATASTLKLVANEYVSSVFGFSNANLTGLWFATNLGNVVGAGDRIGYNGFEADLSDSFNARLVSISGNYSPNNIENLSFEWEYEF
jgi:hypothetical protein